MSKHRGPGSIRLTIDLLWYLLAMLRCLNGEFGPHVQAHVAMRVFIPLLAQLRT